MIEYKVLIQETARQDIRSIIEYIVMDFQEPRIARNLQLQIFKEIESLKTFPKRAHALEDEPYKSKGYRVTYIKNYAIFFKIDEKQHIVHIMRVLYNRREWQSLL